MGRHNIFFFTALMTATLNIPLCSAQEAQLMRPSALTNSGVKPALMKEEGAQSSPVTEPLVENQDSGYSYGDETASLFFGPKALENYLKVIQLFEQNGASPSARLNPADIKDKALQAIIQRIDGNKAEKIEPIIYPYYHLGSILYNARNSWALTINGIVITQKTNKADNELYASSVQPNRATFIWHPQDKRLMQDLRLHARDASDKRDKTLDHRKVKRLFGQPLVNGDGSISFSLEPNQLFYSEFLTVYEGGKDGIIPPPPPLETTDTAPTPPTARVAPAAPVARVAPAITQVPATAAQNGQPTANSSVPVLVRPKKRNALNSFSEPDVFVPVSVPAAIPVTPSIVANTPAPSPSPNLSRAPFAAAVAPPASTLAPVIATVPGSVTTSSQPPASRPNSNEVPLEQLPSIDTIAP